MKIPAIGRRIDRYLLALIAVVVASNLPYLLGEVFPRHDAQTAFMYFHFFYSSLLFDGVIPHWLPYGSFGISADLTQIFNMSPCSYLAAFAGSALGFRDTLFAFYASLLAEQLIFLGGLYVLARHLFRDMRTVFLVCLLTLLGTAWQLQIYFCFRNFYLWPLILYTLAKFFEDKRLWRLGIAAILGTLSISGSVVYSAAITLWVAVLFAVPFMWASRTARVREFAGAWGKTAITFAVAPVVLAVHVWSLRGALVDLEVIIPHRDATTGYVSLETFLKYGSQFGMQAFLQSLFYGWPALLPTWGFEVAVYSGMVTLPFLGWALWTERRPAFVALMLAASFLVLIARSKTFAMVAYNLPLMGYFRHTTYLAAAARVLWIFGAAYGIERLWQTKRPPRTVVAVLCFLLGLSAIWIVLQLTGRVVPNDDRENMWQAHVRLIGWLIATLFLLRALRRKAAPIGSLVFATVVVMSVADLAILQWEIYRTVKALQPPATRVEMRQALAARELKYQPYRTLPPRAGVESLAFRMADNTALTLLARHSNSYLFAGFDPVKSDTRNDLLPYNFLKLAKLDSDHNFRTSLRVTGGLQPKLRLVTRVIYAHSDSDADRKLWDQPKAAEAAVLQGVRGMLPVAAAGGASPTEPTSPVPKDKVTVDDFTANHLLAHVEVNEKDGAWLVYADGFHRGWRAEVDGQATPIVRANLAFKAIHLLRGAHRVEFRYQAGGASTGVAIIGALAAAFLLALLGWLLFRPPPAAVEVGPAA